MTFETVVQASRYGTELTWIPTWFGSKLMTPRDALVLFESYKDLHIIILSDKMLPANFNFTSLAATAAVPTSGHNYKIMSVGLQNVIDYYGYVGNPDYTVVDGNPVNTLISQINDTTQSWQYLTYPSSKGETVFTLQVQATLQSKPGPGTVIDGRGGYMRVDAKSNQLVHGGQPQAWKLIKVSDIPSIYKIAPFEDAFNPNGTLVVTDMSPTVATPKGVRAGLQKDTNALNQLWTFNE